MSLFVQPKINDGRSVATGCKSNGSVLGAVAVYMLSTVDCIELVQAERTLLTLICRAYVCRQDDGPLSSRERCRVR
jgi:hypothetical protein